MRVFICLDVLLTAAMMLQETKPASARKYFLYPSSVEIIFVLIPILVGTSMALSGHNMFHPSGIPAPSRSLHCLCLVPLSLEAQKPTQLIVVKVSGRQGRINLTDNCRGEWRTWGGIHRLDVKGHLVHNNSGWRPQEICNGFHLPFCHYWGNTLCNLHKSPPFYHLAAP